jgi:CRISPR-associated protein Csh1
MTIYTEALDKIQKYQSFYAYMELREIISKYFTIRIQDIKQLSNNELSFYFVAGLEMGRMFKHQKEN